jgi:hypothetical protein
MKRDTINLGSAEHAFLTAITVAKQQSTRSFELRAAPALAKLYQSTTRPGGTQRASSVLCGFSRTLEFRQIEEAP